jgi:hypothetical protein
MRDPDKVGTILIAGFKLFRSCFNEIILLDNRSPEVGLFPVFLFFEGNKSTYAKSHKLIAVSHDPIDTLPVLQ